ncbi:MAG TPA: heme-binding protein [Povalibacter sp.]|nr:heme-binding protein [Povalibacter sp.]
MQTIKEYGPPITLASARQLAEAAEAEAARNGWAMVIAIVDSTSHLVLLHRMEQAQYGSIAVAQLKAKSALDFKRPTKIFEDAVAQGGLGLRMLGIDVICPLEGGVPIFADGRLIGAIGISGALSHQDGAVAAAALATISG